MMDEYREIEKKREEYLSNPLSELDLQLYFLIASVKEKLEKEKDFQERIKLMAQEETYEKVRMMIVEKKED